MGSQHETVRAEEEAEVNSLKMQLEGKVVVLRANVLKAEYRDLKWRLFRVDGGFGASPNTIGTALIGQFLADGEKARMEGYDVERLATEEDCPSCDECFAPPLTICQPECSGRWV